MLFSIIYIYCIIYVYLDIILLFSWRLPYQREHTIVVLRGLLMSWSTILTINSHSLLCFRLTFEREFLPPGTCRAATTVYLWSLWADTLLFLMFPQNEDILLPSSPDFDITTSLPQDVQNIGMKCGVSYRYHSWDVDRKMAPVPQHLGRGRTRMISMTSPLVVRWVTQARYRMMIIWDVSHSPKEKKAIPWKSSARHANHFCATCKIYTLSLWLWLEATPTQSPLVSLLPTLNMPESPLHKLISCEKCKWVIISSPK